MYTIDHEYKDHEPLIWWYILTDNQGQTISFDIRDLMGIDPKEMVNMEYPNRIGYVRTLLEQNDNSALKWLIETRGNQNETKGASVDAAITTMRDRLKDLPDSCQLEITFCEGNVYIELCDSECGDILFCPMYDVTWDQKLKDCLEKAEVYHASKKAKITKLRKD